MSSSKIKLTLMNTKYDQMEISVLDEKGELNIRLNLEK